MIFYRAKVGDSLAAGNNASSQPIPESVRAGDYCLLFIAGPNTTATPTVPSWLTQINAFNNGSGLIKVYVYGGFLPAEAVRTIDISFNGGSRVWCYSGAFWANVDRTTPYFNNQLSNTGAAAASQAFSISNVLASHGMLTLGNAVALNGLAATKGGNWASSGAATDFVTALPPTGGSTYLMQRSTTGESTPRIGVLPQTTNPTDQTVNGVTPCYLAAASGASAPIKTGVVARYTDASNYVAAYLEVVSWSYSGAGPYTYTSSTIYMTVEVRIAGNSVYYRQPAPQLVPNSAATLNDIGFVAQHKLTVATDGTITYSLPLSPSASPLVVTDQKANVVASLSTGKGGFYDMNGSATAAVRGYFSFSMSGSPSPAGLIQVIMGVITNGDTMSMTATPNDPIPIDEQVGNLGNTVGVSMLHRYLFMPSLSDSTVTLTDNLEVGSANLTYLMCGSFVLTPADNSSYGNTNKAISHRVKPSESQMNGWKFYLADSWSLQPLALLRARDRSLKWALNRPGSASFSLRLDDAASKLISPVSTCLMAYRDGTPKWSGPIWTTDEDTEPDVMQVTAAGWLQLLEKRILWADDERYARFSSIDAGVMAAHLFALTSMRGPLPFWIDDVVGTQLRKRSYQRYQQIGPEIQALADIESGYDLWIDPGTLGLTFWDRFEEDLSDSVVFGYDPKGPVHNLESIKRQQAADRIVNVMHVVTKTPGTSPSPQIEYGSMNDYGLFEEQVSLSETTDANVALAYAAGELVYRSRPLAIYSLTPKQWGGSVSVPRPLVDYHLGSIIKFSAHRGSIQVDNQKARVFGLDIDIDNNGNEKVTSLQTVANG